MKQAEALLGVLASGEAYTPSSLQSTLKLQPEDLDRAISKLQGWGMSLTCGDDIHLSEPVTLLSQKRVRSAVGSGALGHLESLEVVAAVDSTNAELKRRGSPESGARVLLAEFQSAGRGRHGRSWQAPFASGLCLSIGWRFSHSFLQRISGASLALGVCVRRALHELGYRDVQLKWPNDLICPRGKLGGMLVELEGEGPWAIFGVGINHRVSGSLPEVDQPWVDLNALERAGDDPGLPDRNLLAGRVIHHVTLGLQAFEKSGLHSFLPEWRSADALLGREIRVERGGGVLLGQAAGIDDTGALLVVSPDGLTAVAGGEVKVRSV